MARWPELLLGSLVFVAQVTLGEPEEISTLRVAFFGPAPAFTAPAPASAGTTPSSPVATGRIRVRLHRRDLDECQSELRCHHHVHHDHNDHDDRPHPA